MISKIKGALIQPVQFCTWLSPLAAIYNYKRKYGVQKDNYEQVIITSEKVALYIKKVNILENRDAPLTLIFTGHSDHSSNYPLSSEQKNTIYCDPPINANCSNTQELFKYYKLQLEHILRQYKPQSVKLEGHSLGAHFALKSAQFILGRPNQAVTIQQIDALCGFSSLSSVINNGIIFYINSFATCLGIILLTNCLLGITAVIVISIFIAIIALINPEYIPRLPLHQIIGEWEMNNTELVEDLCKKKVRVNIHQVENDEIIAGDAQLSASFSEKTDHQYVKVHHYANKRFALNHLCRPDGFEQIAIGSVLNFR